MIDQGLKERLTGAVVLVLLGVVFIPLFLDGPDARIGVNERRALALPAMATNQDNIVAGEPAAQAASMGAAGAEAGQGRADAGQNRVGQAASDGKDTSRKAQPGNGKASAVAAAAVENPLGAWAVQVGSFASQDNAERLSAELKERGYRSFVTRLSTNNTTLYRVRVGPEQERSRAEVLARRLKKDGQPADVVIHP